MATSVLESPIKETLNTDHCTKDHEDKNEKESVSNLVGKRKFEDFTVESTSSVISKIPRLSKTRPFTVSIEGNIGSGKSTFLAAFSDLDNVETHQEPLDLWKNVAGHNLLKMLYQDSKRWSFLFNSYVQLTRLNIHMSDCQSKIKIIERSLMNNRACFLESSRDTGSLNDAEFQVLKAYYDFMEKHLDVGLDLIVYLRTSPEVVYERMRKRNREEESTVPLEYLEQLHKYYEAWLYEKTRPLNVELIIIDANKDLDSVLKQIELHKDRILGSVAQ